MIFITGNMIESKTIEKLKAHLILNSKQSNIIKDIVILKFINPGD